MKSSAFPWFVAVLLALVAAARAETVALFNGRDLTGWHIDVPAMDKDPAQASPFIVRDGKLVSLAKPGGHIMLHLPKGHELERWPVSYENIVNLMDSLPVGWDMVKHQEKDGDSLSVFRV